MSTSLGALPRPVPRPLPGVTLPASPECPSPQSRGWLWGGWPWSRVWTWGWSSVWVTRVFDVVGVIAGRGVGRRVACLLPCPVSMVWVTWVFEVVGVVAGRGLGCSAGRGWCWWCGLRWCSTLWAWLLAEGWFVACPAHAPCPASPYRLRRSILRHCIGAGCGVDAWVTYWWSRLWSIVCVTWVFEVVGEVAGRELGRGVGRCWPWPVSMELAFPVFDDVGVVAGRELGRGAGCRCGRWCVPQECSMTWARLLAEVWVAAWSTCGRYWCRWCGTSACSSMFEGVGRCAGRRLGRLGGRWLTTFVVFEGVDLGVGRRLGRLGRRGCVLVDDFCGGGVGFSSVRDCGRGWWSSSRSSRVSVRRASVV